MIEGIDEKVHLNIALWELLPKRFGTMQSVSQF